LRYAGIEYRVLQEFLQSAERVNRFETTAVRN
jgi:hypothetical protein